MDLNIAQQIYKILHKFRKDPFNEIFFSTEILQKILDIVKKKITLRLVLPAFHGKSPNRNLVFSYSPDYGEYLGIQVIAALHEQLSKIYPSVEICLLHEGHFYGDVCLGGDDLSVASYEQAIQQLIQPYSFITSYSASKFFPKKSYKELRETFLADYCPSLSEIEDSIASKENYKNLYFKLVAMYHNKHQEPIKAEFKTKRALLKNYSKPMAKLHLRKYLGYSRLIKEYFSEIPYIKLSQLYKEPSVTDQVGINLLADYHGLGTSTFYTVVQVKEHYFEFITVQEASAKQYATAKMNNLFFFKHYAA